jgi:hypothetical protein
LTNIKECPEKYPDARYVQSTKKEHEESFFQMPNHKLCAVTLF